MTEGVPEVYADQFAVNTNIWGVSLLFSKLAIPVPSPEPPPPMSEPQVGVRMSLQHAKAMTLILRKHLKQWERDNIEITLPRAAFEAFGISPDDW